MPKTSGFKRWRADRKRFPVTWLSYRRRVRDDVETLYKTKGGPEFFDETFIAALAETAEQLESREMKLFAYQVALSRFMVLGLISSDASATILGIPLKDAPGIKELLLVLSTSIALIAFGLQQSKSLRITIIERLVELKIDSKFTDFAKLSNKAPFDISFYIAKQYNNFIFATLPTRLTTGFVWLLIATLIFVFIVFMWACWVYVILKILQAPALGMWSYAAVIYGVSVYLCFIVWLIRTLVPFPYRDMSELKESNAAQKTGHQ